MLCLLTQFTQNLDAYFSALRGSWLTESHKVLIALLIIDTNDTETFQRRREELARKSLNVTFQGKIEKKGENSNAMHRARYTPKLSSIQRK